MNSNYKKFLKINKKLIKYYPNNGSVIVIDRGGSIYTSIHTSLLACALNKVFKVNPVTLSDFIKPEVIEIFKSFGINKFKRIFNYMMVVKEPLIATRSAIETINTIYKIKKNGFQWFIDDYKFANINLGDLVYDTHIRHNNNFIKQKIDTRFVNLLFKTIFRTIKIEKSVDKNKAKFVIVGTHGYCYNDAIALRVGLKKNLKVFEPQPHQIIQFSKSHIKHGVDSLFINRKILQKKISSTVIENYKKNFYKANNVSYFTGSQILFRANKFKKKINKIELLNQLNVRKKYSKIILIAPHIFSDAVHASGTLIFKDYYSQLYETLEYIKNKKIKDCLWIIKIHPWSIFYNENNIIEPLIEQFNYEDFYLCPKNINTKDLINICDTVITGRGTAGIEFACNGKLPILAGPAAYSNLGFTFDPKNKKEYFNKIKNISKILPLKKNQITLANKVMYILQNNLNQTSIIRSKIIPHDKFSQSIKLTNSSQTNSDPEKNLFSDEFILNVKKNRFENDTYYKDLIKKLRLL